MNKNPILTDLYQLTMGEAYHASGKNDIATFELFFRSLPKDWGHFILNGIEDAVDHATGFKFEEEDIAYLRSQEIFSEPYLKLLQNLKPECDINAIPEGTPVGPNTPVIQITGPRIEAQLLESRLLNIINHQTLIATKANRIVRAAQERPVIDYGMRRAHGESGAMEGARAAYIAGAKGTSNVLAGKEFGIPIFGTHAHSFVLSYESELEAFRAYTKTFPDKTTLLIDTYDTIQGARNAIIVAKELETRGHKLGAVRLDSGDLAELSKEVRVLLNNAGLDYVKIVASNDLNEYKISQLIEKGARIDAFGVGTELITAKPVSAINGVYKLVQDSSGPKSKKSEEKTTYPGIKTVNRIEEKTGKISHDIIGISNEETQESLLKPFVRDGKRVRTRDNITTIRERVENESARMPEHTLKLNSTPYEVRTTRALEKLLLETQQKIEAI